MMNCNVIRDLLPLYADDVCSKESRELVEAHLTECAACRRLLSDMQVRLTRPEPMPKPTLKQKKIRLWQASLLQSVLMLVAFLILTVGVAREAKTPLGDMNGYWAFTLALPAAGFMLSLANWYFVRLYRSKRAFMLASAAATFGVTLGAYIWGLNHYEYFKDFGDFQWTFFAGGVVFSLILCVGSFLSSYFYADLVGKE